MNSRRIDQRLTSAPKRVYLPCHHHDGPIQGKLGTISTIQHTEGI